MGSAHGPYFSWRIASWHNLTQLQKVYLFIPVTLYHNCSSHLQRCWTDAQSEQRPPFLKVHTWTWKIDCLSFLDTQKSPSLETVIVPNKPGPAQGSKIAKGLQSVKVFSSTVPEKPKKLDRIGPATFAFFNIHCCKTSKNWSGTRWWKFFWKKV